VAGVPPALFSLTKRQRREERFFWPQNQQEPSLPLCPSVFVSLNDPRHPRDPRSKIFIFSETLPIFFLCNAEKEKDMMKTKILRNVLSVGVLFALARLYSH
jgi:hypothetical protein